MAGHMEGQKRCSKGKATKTAAAKVQGQEKKKKEKKEKNQVPSVKQIRARINSCPALLHQQLHHCPLRKFVSFGLYLSAINVYPRR